MPAFNPMVGGPAMVASAGSPPSPTSVQTMADGKIRTIDGTPVRVATLAIAAALGLYALKLSGLEFNVGLN